MYVLCDPGYTGPSNLKKCTIQGLEQYLNNQISLSQLLAQLGEDNTDFTYVTAQQQSEFWEAVNKGFTALAEEIFDAQCAIRGDGNAADSFTVSEAAFMCGISVPDNATLKEFALAIGEQYQWDFRAIDRWISQSNMMGISELSAMLGEEVYGYSESEVSIGESVSYISGIQKMGEYSLRVIAAEKDYTMLYELADVPLAPLHYYGDRTIFDYSAHSFGFQKGDLNTVRAATAQPLGAGPYQFVQCADDTILFQANPYYYLGEPKTEQIVFYEDTSSDYSWKTESLLNGSLDICCSTSGVTRLNQFIEENDGILIGEKYQISLAASDSSSYTYLGMKPELLNIDGDPYSDASKSLRKALGTFIAVYRDEAIENFRKEGWEISVLEAPVSDSSWAANEVSEAAFSIDATGAPIYTEDMTDTQRYDAARMAALTWLERAGYTIENNKVAAVPEGGRVSFEVQINTFSGEMPYAELLQNAQKAFAEIGIELKIRDLHDEETGDDFFPVEPGKSEMWVDFWAIPLSYDYGWLDRICWSDSADPAAHLLEVYFSNTVNDGAEAGRYADIYGIADPALDALILEAQSSVDQQQRMELYRSCIEIISDIACEVPLYQDQDSTIFSVQRVKEDTIPVDLTTSYNWIREVYQIEVY